MWQRLWWIWFFVVSISRSGSVLRRGQRRKHLYHVGRMIVIVGRFHGWWFFCQGRKVEFRWNKNFQIGMFMPIGLVGVYMNGGDLGWFHIMAVGGPIIWVGKWDHMKIVRKWRGFSRIVLRVHWRCADDFVVVRIGNWLDVLWRYVLGLWSIHFLGCVVLVRNRFLELFECFDACAVNVPA